MELEVQRLRCLAIWGARKPRTDLFALHTSHVYRPVPPGPPRRRHGGAPLCGPCPRRPPPSFVPSAPPRAHPQQRLCSVVKLSKHFPVVTPAPRAARDRHPLATAPPDKHSPEKASNGSGVARNRHPAPPPGLVPGGALLCFLPQTFSDLPTPRQQPLVTPDICTNNRRALPPAGPAKVHPPLPGIMCCQRPRVSKINAGAGCRGVKLKDTLPIGMWSE